MPPIQTFYGFFHAQTGWHNARDKSSLSGQRIDSASFKTHHFAPIRNTQGNTIDCDKIIESCVSCLFSFSSPPAITRFVVSIIVDSVNRVMCRWSKPHIFKKRFKAIPPSLTHYDSPTSVDGVFWAPFIKAPVFNLAPSIVFWGFAAAMSRAISLGSQKLRSGFLCETATAKGGFANIGCGCNCRIPAVALATPHHIPCGWNLHGDNHKKTTKSFSSKIKSFRHWDFPLLTKLATLWNYQEYGVQVNG